MRVISPPPLIPDTALSTADDLRQGGGGIAVCEGMDELIYLPIMLPIAKRKVMGRERGGGRACLSQ